MAPRHGWLVAREGNNAVELINHARTAAYLANPDITIDGIDICSILDFGGCENYKAIPACYPDIGGWVDFPNVAANYVSTPSFAGINITGDITIVAEINPDDATPATNMMIVAKAQTAGQFAYGMYLDPSGRLVGFTSNDGTAVVFHSSSIAIPGLTAGQFKYVAWSLDVNNGAAGRTSRYYVSNYGVTWLLYQTIVTAGTTVINSGTSQLEIGSELNGAFQFGGLVRHISIRSGLGAGTSVGGTEHFRMSRNSFIGVAANATTMTADTGQTLTIHHSGGTPTVISTFVPAHESWDVQSFEAPDVDDAPWWNPDYPESADALGFFVEEWTGLDDRHIVRSVTRTGRERGGGTPNTITNHERVMKLNLILLAGSEDGMMYLFRWFAALLESVCSRCHSTSLLIRDYCGSTDEVTKGVVELRDVALIEGLGWEADPVRRGACFVRRASFTVAAGDPCMYLPDTEPTVTPGTSSLGPGLLTANYNLTRNPARPSCSELPATTRQTYTWDAESAMGAKAPVITFNNDDPEFAFPFRAIVYYDPHEIGATPNPCGLLQLGQIYVQPMPPYSWLKWDVAGREIEYRDATTGDWIEGFFLLQGNDGPQRYFALPCSGQYHLALEPATLAIERIGVSGNVFEWNGTIFSSPHYPDVDIAVQERVSCS